MPASSRVVPFGLPAATASHRTRIADARVPVADVRSVQYRQKYATKMEDAIAAKRLSLVALITIISCAWAQIVSAVPLPDSYSVNLTGGSCVTHSPVGCDPSGPMINTFTPNPNDPSAPFIAVSGTLDDSRYVFINGASGFIRGSADLRTGDLELFARSVGSAVLGAQVQMKDTISLSPGYTYTFVFDGHGLVTLDPFASPGSSFVNVFPSLTVVNAHTGIGCGPMTTIGLAANGSIPETTSTAGSNFELTVTCDLDPSHSPTDGLLAGILDDPLNPKIPLKFTAKLGDDFTSIRDATFDFGDPLITINGPAGFTFTSGSGVFLTATQPTSAAPEPGSLLLLSIALAGLGFSRRKRAR